MVSLRLIFGRLSGSGAGGRRLRRRRNLNNKKEIALRGCHLQKIHVLTQRVSCILCSMMGKTCSPFAADMIKLKQSQEQHRGGPWCHCLGGSSAR